MRCVCTAALLTGLIGLAVLLTIGGAAAQKIGDYTVGTGKWEPYLELSLEPGTQASRGTVDLFVPVLQSNDGMAFVDMRGVGSSAHQREGNFGLGFRKIFRDPGEGFGDLIMGANAFFDAKRSDNGFLYLQGGAGVELMFENVDVRANVYIAEPDSNVVASRNVLGGVVVGNQVLIQQDRLEARERALSGYDFEVGYGIDTIKNHKLWVYPSFFHFEADHAPTLEGTRLRMEYRIEEPFDWSGARLTVGGEFQWDHVREEQGFGMVRLRIPLFDPVGLDKRKRPKLVGIDKRMTDRVQRDVDIVVQAQNPNAEPGDPAAPENTAQSTSVALDQDGNPVMIFFVSAAGAGAACTQDAPCTVAQAVAASGDGSIIALMNDAGAIVPGAIIALDRNGQLVAGNSTVTLNGNVPLMLSASSGTPELQSALSRAVDLADNSVVQDIRINGNGAGNDGIRGDTISNVTIRNVTIDSVTGNAIDLDTIGGTLTIANNTFDSGDDSVVLDNDDGANTNVTLVLTGNTFNDLGSGPNSGFNLQFDGTDATTGTVSGNTFTGLTSPGLVTTQADTSTLNLGVTGNTFMNTDGGIDLTTDDTSALTVNVSNNTFDTLTADAVHIDTVAASTTVVNATISGNRFTAMDADAVDMGLNGATTGTQTISNNTFNGIINANSAVFYTLNDTGNTTLNITGNTINSVEDVFLDIATNDTAMLGFAINNNSLAGGGTSTQQAIVLDAGNTSTMTGTVSSNTISGIGNAGGDEAILVDANGTLTVRINNNNINNNSGNSVEAVASAAATDLDLTINNNTFNNNGNNGVDLTVDDGDFCVSVTNNTFIGPDSLITDVNGGAMTIAGFANEANFEAANGGTDFTIGPGTGFNAGLVCATP